MIATEEQRDAARVAANQDFLSYVIHMWPQYEFAAHNLLLIDALASVERGETKRLMVFMPPRHGKSLINSRLFPAFYLGRNPHREVMVASYGADLANTFSYNVRSQISDAKWPFRGVTLKRGRATVKAWGLDGRDVDGRAYEGGLVAAGVGGPLTGRGADLLLIDDVVKDRVQADSVTWRERTLAWYEDVARTRLMPGGAIVITLTRWHEGDLAGALLERARHGEDGWQVICLPARAYRAGEAPWYADERDPLGRLPGEPLWPDRFGETELAAIERESSIRTWSALYQASPSAGEGNVFLKAWFNNRFATQVELLRLQRVIITVDAAWKEGVQNSYSAATAWGDGDDGKLYVLNAWRDHVSFDSLKLALADFWAEVMGQTGMIPTLVIEDKASGTSLLQSLAVTHPRIPLKAFPDKDSTLQRKLATTSKEARADSATPPFRAGLVNLPSNKDGEHPWVSAWVKEHCDFPTALHNDWVDTSSIAMALLYTQTVAAAQGQFVTRESLVTERLNNAGGYNATRGRAVDLGQGSGYNVRRGRLIGGR